jgi:hypothetical protein
MITTDFWFDFKRKDAWPLRLSYLAHECYDNLQTQGPTGALITATYVTSHRII